MSLDIEEDSVVSSRRGGSNSTDVALDREQIGWTSEINGSISMHVDCNGLQGPDVMVSYVEGLDSVCVWVAVYPHAMI